MNSSTFLSCSSDSSPPVSGSAIASPRALSRGWRQLWGQTAIHALRACVQDPKPRDVGRAVVALDLAQRLHALRLVAGIDLRFAQAQLRVLGALQAALLDALLDEREALVGTALVDIVEADLHQVVAVLGRQRVRLVLVAVLLRLGRGGRAPRPGRQRP